MNKTIMPVLVADPDATWITIGDGFFGSDAHFLRRHGISALATSLTDTTLSIAQSRGYIGEFKSVNAEDIAFPDDSYDYVLCKEAYHHFPRPPIALYEMLRVARKAVVMIEPQESSRRLLAPLKALVKRILRPQESPSYERCGNFIFRVNPHEIAKIMAALGHPMIAIKRFNDFYYRSALDAEYSIVSLPAIITRLGIAVQDVLCFSKLLDFGLATIILFKVYPDDKTAAILERQGFRVNSLPQNPYREH